MMKQTAGWETGNGSTVFGGLYKETFGGIGRGVETCQSPGRGKEGDLLQDGKTANMKKDMELRRLKEDVQDQNN